MFASDELNIMCTAVESYKQSYKEELDSLIEIGNQRVAIGRAKQEEVLGIKNASASTIKKIDEVLIKLRKLQMQACGL